MVFINFVIILNVPLIQIKIFYYLLNFSVSIPAVWNLFFVIWNLIKSPWLLISALPFHQAQIANSYSEPPVRMRLSEGYQ